MARSEYALEVRMACVPNPPPVSVLPGMKFGYADWSFGTGRPASCNTGASKCERFHAGGDLAKAKANQLVVAPEKAVIRILNGGWTGKTRKVALETDTLFIVLGGVIPNSHKEWDLVEGDEVVAGDPLGRVQADYKMIHFETYERAPDRVNNSQWWVGKPPPVGLLNPLNYIQAMAGDPQTLANYEQRHAALAALGYYEGVIRGPWTETSKAALERTQDDLGLEPDGLWGPDTDKAIQRAVIEGAKNFVRPCRPEPVAGKNWRPDPTSWRESLGAINWPLVGGVAAVAVGAGAMFELARSSRRRSS